MDGGRRAVGAVPERPRRPPAATARRPPVLLMAVNDEQAVGQVGVALHVAHDDLEAVAEGVVEAHRAQHQRRVRAKRS